VALVSAIPCTRTSSLTFSIPLASAASGGVLRQRRTERCSAAAVDHDHVGRHADQEAERQKAQAELPVAEAPHGAPGLADHVADRAARDGVEDELERLRAADVAHDRADEGWAPADQSGGEPPAPRGLGAAQR